MKPRDLIFALIVVTVHGGLYFLSTRNKAKVMPSIPEHLNITVREDCMKCHLPAKFEELERQGFECLLISSRSLRRVAGRKSDITDAQWIQTLHTYGLLEGSFRPQGDLVALRTLLRHRGQLIEHRSPHIQHMQKALLQMNVQLTQAVTDITGLTGLKIIRAILAGERDPQTLATLREPGCKKNEEDIGKALTGTWREEHLFVLQQSVQLYDFYAQQI